MKRAFQLVSIPLVLVLLLVGLTPSIALDRETRFDVMTGVVQISLVKIEDGEVYYLTWGSGTIVTADGLILTNCHVADAIKFGFSRDEIPEYDYLGVGITVRSDRPPQLAFLGEAIQADPYLDLAVIRITHKIDGTPIKPGDLNLPYIERGDSDFIDVGDELNIFGYPGIGGDTVTFTSGVVSGFSLDAAIDGRAWIKTDASISGGNSGGTAVDSNGLLVGVPTRAGAGTGDDPVDCRPVKDTNGDGRVDGNDDCVPLGGFINALRPVQLAEPIIERAILGLPDSPDDPQPSDDGPTGRAKITNLFFAPDINEFNQPTSVITSLPSGARSLYLYFDFDGMSDGSTLEMTVAIDGQVYDDWGLPAGPWSGGTQGKWWIGWDDAEFVDGTYDLTIYVDGDRMGQAQIEVGGPPTNEPAFSNILFDTQESSSGGPVDPSVLIPAGTKTLYAFFDHDNMSSGLEWTRSWLVDGNVGLSKDEPWDEGSSGSYALELTSQQGLSAGAYRLNLYIEGELAAMSDFWVTGGDDGGGASFDPITFAQGIDRSDNPVGAAQSFATGLTELYAFTGYEGMEDGMDFGVNWYIDGQQVIADSWEWDEGESGPWHYQIYSDPGTLPDGEYGVELMVEDQLVQEGTTTIGTGVRPTPEPDPTPDDGVLLEGTITDLDTGRPIAGAVMLVLNPGVTLDTFQWTDAEVYTSDDTDRNGVYSLPYLLERGECYTMIAGAEGYWTFGEDDLCVGPDIPAVAELSIRLEKK